MPTRIVVMESDPAPAREPHAVCNACGRRGTAARVTWCGESPTVYRYCRRCWPAAHRRTIAEIHDGMFRSAAEWLDSVQAATSAEEAARLEGPSLGVTVRWDWSLIPGSLWREFASDRSHRAGLSRS